MKLKGPERYELKLTRDTAQVTCALGTNRFSGIAASDVPKLYVISYRGKPIYVGITRQKIVSRLRYGMKAQGKGGYYGYKWRLKHKKVVMDVWGQTDAKDRKKSEDIETVEAEVVFLIRSAGQWPLFQTEIHFHPSKATHRALARKIVSYYKKPIRAMR